MLISFFFTFICEENGIFIQKNLCDFSKNDKLITIIDLISNGYKVLYLEDGYISFEKNDKYMSARPDFSLSDQKSIQGWEKFRFFENYIPFEILSLPESKFISKKIHQTDSSKDIRKSFIENIAQIKEFCPGYTYNYYNEKDRFDFIYNNFGWEIANLYMKINPKYGAARADLFRYLCVYKNGGIYLDMKSGIEKPISEIINFDDNIVLSHWDSEKSDRFHGWGRGQSISHIEKGEFMQWFIIARSGNSLLRKVINQVISNINLYDPYMHGVGRDAIFNITGPFVFTRSIIKNIKNYNHRIIDAESSGIVYCNVNNYERITNYSSNNLPLIL